MNVQKQKKFEHLHLAKEYPSKQYALRGVLIKNYEIIS